MVTDSEYYGPLRPRVTVAAAQNEYSFPKFSGAAAAQLAHCK
jgi:hypothetical protein